MAVSLGGIALSPALKWPDRFKGNGVAQSSARVLSGRLVLYTAALYRGRSIVLEAQQDSGWLTKAMCDACISQSLAYGTLYTLDYNGEIYTVYYDWRDGPACSFTPLLDRQNYPDTDYFTGQIRLITA